MTRNVRDQAAWLAGRFDALERKVAGLRSQGDLAFSSIEDGAIVEKDLDGNLVSSVGKQHDGSHVQVPYVGPVPAAPVAPALAAIPGVVEVRWSGKFVDDAVSAMDFKHVAVHVGATSAVDVIPSTQVATIRGELGDVATVTAPEGILYVCLVAWSEAGKASAPSAVTAVYVPAPADGAALNGKMTVSTQAPALADGEGKPDNALWNEIDAATGTQVAVWRWDGAEWVDFPITETMLPLVNIAEGTYGRLQGVQLEADAVDGMVITGAVIQSPGEGAGYQLTVDGYVSKDGDGNVTVRLPADGSPAQFRGDIEARSLTATGQVSFQASENEVASAASIILESGVSSPISEPSIGASYESTYLPYTGSFDGQSTVGLARTNSLWWRVSRAGNYITLDGINDAGAIAQSIATGLGSSNGIAAIGGELFILGKWVGATEDRHVAVYSATTGAYLRRWVYIYYGSGKYQPGIGTDGSNLLIGQCWFDGHVSWRTFNKASGALISDTESSHILASDIAGIFRGPADFGQERVIISAATGNTVAFTLGGTTIGWGGWVSASGRPVFGLAWESGRFWHLQKDALIGYSTIAAPAGEGAGDTEDWWVAHTWTGLGGLETQPGPPKRFKFMRRSELQFSASMAPPGVTGAKFYLARKATTPARTDLHLIATVAGVSGRLTILPTNWQTLPSPPSVNTFPSALPGMLRSRIGAFEVRGDGSGKWGPLTFNPDGTMSSAAVPAWVPITQFLSGCSVGDFGFVPAYRAWPDGKVELRGIVKGTFDVSKQAFQLPPDVWPTKAVDFVAATSVGGTTPAVMRIEINVTLSPGALVAFPQGVTRSWISLDALYYYQV